MIKQQKEREEILDRELKKNIEKATMLEIEIALQKELDPEEKSAKKVKSYDSNGRPQSYSQIKRREYIDIKEEELNSVKLLIKTIKDLY